MFLEYNNMFFYIILALLVFAITSYFWMPFYRDAVIKKAKPELLERVLSGSDGSINGNKKIRDVLVKEGFLLGDINKAIAASLFQRQSKNFTLAPIMATLACLAILAKMLLPGFGIIVSLVIWIVVIVVAVKAGMFKSVIK